jgi:hypothetical protein
MLVISSTSLRPLPPWGPSTFVAFRTPNSDMCPKGSRGAVPDRRRQAGRHRHDCRGAWSDERLEALSQLGRGDRIESHADPHSITLTEAGRNWPQSWSGASAVTSTSWPRSRKVRNNGVALPLRYANQSSRSTCPLLDPKRTCRNRLLDHLVGAGVDRACRPIQN